ncbi:nuclear transport factor 2 family protein [Blastomonas fulva]|jgi:hypothetical protein|uniref:nuclear transport factor 2 family protein n=1 Tax=Blastomonas fulva TaxID=1550728 RepID=UPI003D2A59AF
MTKLASIIRDYYSRIDACDIDWVVSIFAPDAVYERAGFQYGSLSEIERFFRVERQIRGRHEIADTWSDAERRTIWVTGTFDGFGAKGDARRICFADMWQFNTAALVDRRQTYLATGHEYVLQ